MAGTSPAMTYRFLIRKVSTGASLRISSSASPVSRSSAGNIDAGQRIGAADHQNVAGRHAGQRLTGAQHRQRAFEAAQIEGLFRHQ